MIGLKNDIESLRSLSQIFTPTNFDRIVRKNDYANTQARIRKHISSPNPINNLEVLQFIYKELLENYKSEYLYKNALLNKLLCLCVSKNLALLQAEASACGFELANVPNVSWH